MTWLAKVFALRKAGFNPAAGVIGLVLFLVPLVVLGALDGERYYLTVSFGAVFAALSDPGGTFSYRMPRVALVGVSGGVLTALAFGVGQDAWGWVVLAAFGVTLLAGLAIKYGAHRFFAAYLINIWFIIALALPVQATANGTPVDAWKQGLAWLVGVAFWVAVSVVIWIAHGRRPLSQLMPEIPGDTSTVELTRPKVLYALIRALAVAIAAAVSFGFGLPNADWMPIATIVAMKPNLDQAEFVAIQRLVGAILGSALAAIFLLAVTNTHALELLIAVIGGVGGAIRQVNYALYTAAIAAAVLIAEDLPNPTDLAAEGRRVVFTFIGVGIAVLVTLLANRLNERSAATPSTTAAA